MGGPDLTGAGGQQQDGVIGRAAAVDIETVEAKDRPAFDARGRAARYDWRGCFWGYRRIGPRRIPEWGEVGYVYPDGYEVYFRGRILSYELIV